MYQFTVTNLPGGLTITGDVDGVKEVFEHVHFWQSLPTVCPIDGTPTILHFKAPDKLKYYGLASTGTPRYEYKCGQHQDGGTLFAKDQWTLWDGEREVTVWENGRLTGNGGVKNAPPNKPPASNGNGKSAPPPPPEVKYQTPPTTQAPVYRDGIDPKVVMRSGEPFTFKGAADAWDFAIALGAYADKQAAEEAYTKLKDSTKPASAAAMWAAWISHLAGVMLDKETWSK